MEYKGYTLTNEQYLYITHNDRIDTKLIACAGSGKTQCIVLKNIYLLENNIYKSDEILIVVFGRHAQNDLVKRVKSVDSDNFINTELISTIDALSKYIIDDNNKIDVSLLSYKFMEYLDLTPIEILKQNNKLNKIRCVFVDEAQDLNYIQYRIIMLLKDKLNVILNFIGDPNQNIFQFRDSEAKYFIEFNGLEFVLTHNFRSHSEIIDFSKDLRSDKTHPIVSTKGDLGIKPIIFEGNIEEMIIKLINELLDDSNTDLSDIAFISPIKGKISQNSATGLCMVANTLAKHNINFKQFYDESKDEANPNIKYEPLKNYCSLITICGSKGLQWKHVILIGAKPCMINYYTFTPKQHEDEKNLLYVACSRSINTLSVLVETNRKSMSINHWFGEIDKNTYEINSDSNYEELKFPPLTFNNKLLFDNKITKILDNIPIQILNELSNIIDYDNILKDTEKIYDLNFSKIEYVSPIFLGKYTESLFVNSIKIKNSEELKEYIDLNNLLNNKNIIHCINQQTYEWINKNKENMTWDKFDSIKDTLSAKISNEIILIRQRNRNNLLDFNKYSYIINNSYYNDFVNSNLEQIKKNYHKYKNCVDFNKLKKLQFNCEVFQHSIQTQHYYHISHKGNKFKSLLTLYNEMFDNINNYVYNTDLNVQLFNQYIENYNLIGEIDFIDSNNELWEIKVAQDINLKYILQLLMYNIMFEKKNEYKLNFLNFLKGEKVIIKLNLDDNKINRLIEIFQKYSESKK